VHDWLKVLWCFDVLVHEAVFYLTFSHHPQLHGDARTKKKTKLKYSILKNKPLNFPQRVFK